jgi:hypothetical protein
VSVLSLIFFLGCSSMVTNVALYPGNGRKASCDLSAIGS